MLWGIWLLVNGTIDKKALKFALEKAQPKIHACYAPEKAKDKHLKGVVKVKWQIEADGKASDVGVVESSMKNANVEACLVDVIEHLRFPKAQEGPVVITYPFDFE